MIIPHLHHCINITCGRQIPSLRERKTECPNKHSGARLQVPCSVMERRSQRANPPAILAVLAVVLALLGVSAQSPPGTALVGATLIDGTGGRPVADAVIVISGAHVTAVGPKSAVPIPSDAKQIDVRGRWIVPGLIDTNVHLSLYGGQNERYETLVRYQPRQKHIVLEAAPNDLSYRRPT